MESRVIFIRSSNDLSKNEIQAQVQTICEMAETAETFETFMATHEIYDVLNQCKITSVQKCREIFESGETPPFHFLLCRN